MSRDLKNIIEKQPNIIGPDIRANLYKEVVRDGTPFPIAPLSYEDIDKEFDRWVNEDLELIHDGKKLNTMVMYSNQRFSEFMQSWANTDNNKNMFLHFKLITREKNPKGGTIVNEVMNVPGDRWYTIKKVHTVDEAGRPYTIAYKMRQPYAIDLKYKVSIITNKIEVINEFNNLVNEKFKAQQCYIRPNGHFIPMEIESISDESENDIKDRQYMVQTYQIKVLGYIINEDDLAVFEEPVVKIMDIDVEGSSKGGAVASINEYEDGSIDIETVFTQNIGRYSMHSDTDININDIEVSDIVSFQIEINATEMNVEIYKGHAYENLIYDKYGNPKGAFPFKVSLKDGDEITFKNVKLTLGKHNAVIRLKGKPSI